MRKGYLKDPQAFFTFRKCRKLLGNNVFLNIRLIVLLFY